MTNAYDNLLNPAGFGVFSDEGLVSGPYYTREAAENAMKEDDPDGSSGLYVEGVCPEPGHDDNPNSACPACGEDDDET